MSNKNMLNGITIIGVTKRNIDISGKLVQDAIVSNQLKIFLTLI